MCVSCLQANCFGNCVASSNWIVNWPTYPQSAGQVIQTTGITGGYYPAGFTPMQASSNDINLQEFLDLIDSKEDPEACMVFVEKQLSCLAAQKAFLEQCMSKYKEELDVKEKKFIELCKRYRPSITQQILNRIKKLKAFY